MAHVTRLRNFARRRVVVAVVAAVLVIAAVIALKAVVLPRVFDNAPQGDKYQAVFLTNGQVYFGKLSSVAGTTYTLKQVYYIQSNPQQGAASPSPGPQLSLVQLGNEIHGPEAEMQIQTDQVLFWENLKDDSKVVDSIKNNK